ncbi:proline-rich protein PRCC [Gouania willdenowi]|uniref:Proline rich mitotic checkpoint control factor n=1 Tax=Gouania willdenowi TaxID=441366 RepID=A0A8C5DLW6_GOUWI|nr:proline-rich protein PRCC [Gouania willdenowi]XP_028316850.1 proline-rich protein PRCC [Gouania willdenowi]XP_028316851.1 proline-rich protein PRCC [Gouania willdenowi]
MSLVAYGSSDESDSGGDVLSISESRPSTGRLFSQLPAPKKPGAKPSAVHSTREEPVLQPSMKGLFSSLPKPRKRTEPVKITVPQIHRRDSDSDDDEPSPKKQRQSVGSGLASLLPQPKNLTVKAKDRPLIPHTLTKRQEPKVPKPVAAVKGLIGSSASPSAIKAAAKSAALQVARQITTDDQDEADISPQNYFSLCESSRSSSELIPNFDPETSPSTDPLPFPAPEEPGQSDAPLDFGGNQEGVGAWGGQYQQHIPGPEDNPQGYYSEPYLQETSPGQPEAEEPGQSSVFDDEAFMRLQGKRNRGKEEVKFLEISGDDQLSGNQQWLTKSISEEKQTRQSHSKKRGGMPTGQQRRKHQITYLIHQAKERELELKNSWAENKLTRRQTQAKYGF